VQDPLLSEYIRQQAWRPWQTYLANLPIHAEDTVLDIGCATGHMAGLLAQHAKATQGIDINPLFIEYCRQHATPNQSFECLDASALDTSHLSSIQGIWSSFALSYLSDPGHFLKKLYDNLPSCAWIGLTDVSNFISGNMPKEHQFYSLIKDFENSASQSGLYDFDFGGKLPKLLQTAGFTLTHWDDNITDPELNSPKPLLEDQIVAWQHRLQRMPKLSSTLGQHFDEFCEAFLTHLASDEHCAQRCVTFAVAVKA
jgi:SAM-dependent methyltransferase